MATKGADLLRVAAVDARLMADEEEEEAEGRNVCFNVIPQLRSPIQEFARCGQCACPEQQARGNIPQSETEQGEEEKEQLEEQEEQEETAAPSV